MLPIAILVAATCVPASVAASAAAVAPDVRRSGAVPPVPVLPMPLFEGINRDSHLTAAELTVVAGDVRWLQERLNVSLPKIHWTGGPLATDGVFDARTATAVGFFKFWANVARAMLHQTVPFPRIDRIVGPKTAALIAVVSAYFQLNPVARPLVVPAPPGGASPASASADQATALDALNQDRARYGVPQLRTDTALMAKAQAWSAHLAAAGALSHDSLTAGVTTCWRALAQNVGYASTIVGVEVAFIADVGINPPGHRLNIENGAYDLVGVGVTRANGLAFVVQDFKQSC